MSDYLSPWLGLAFAAFAVGMFFGGALSGENEHERNREKFMTFCTAQGVSYAACKDEWEKP